MPSSPLSKRGPRSNMRPNGFVVREPEKYRPKKQKHSVTKCFSPVAPGFTGRGSLGCPRGGLFHLLGVGQGGVRQGASGRGHPGWMCTEQCAPSRFGSCVSVQACPGHLSRDTSLTEVRLLAPDMMTGQKATITLCQSDFSSLRPP